MSAKNSRLQTITLRDVARAAGVAPSTVSRVLAQSSSPNLISVATTKRVLEVAEQLGYRPNLAARMLRGQATNMIAIMIADISNPMYHLIVRTVQAVARVRNYDVLIANTDHLYENEIHFCEAIMRRPVDGVLMVPYLLTNEDVQRLIAYVGAPVVALTWPGVYENVDTVTANDAQASYEVVQWLVEQKGHQRISFIGVSEDFPPGVRREASYRRAMNDAGLPARYVPRGDFTIESGRRAMRMLLESSQPPTAVFACNDLMAIGAVAEARAMGRRVPDDIAFVGFDNIPETTIVSPTLTTVEQNAVEFGQHLARALFERIDGTVSGEGRNYIIAHRLIEREST